MTDVPSRARPSILQALALFQSLVSPGLICGWMRAAGVRFYERLYTPRVVLWGLLYQRLQGDHTLDAVVGHVANGMADTLEQRHRAPLGERVRSQNTAGYSRARARLPLRVLQQVVRHFAQMALGEGTSEGRWHGHEVMLLDGTTVRMRPWGDIAEHYGLQNNQHRAAYWVIMRLVVGFSLHSGALTWAGQGPCSQSEQSLAHQVLAQGTPDTLWMGDRNFGVFSIAQAVRHEQGWVLLRLTRSRAHYLAKRTLQANEDLAVQWTPSQHDQYDPALSVEPIAGRLLFVRLEREGFRPIDLHLFTTLCDVTRYTRDELVTLYGQRWQVELDLRYVKRTLDLHLLQAKSVAMVQKELWAGLGAYNLVRVFMCRAAHQAGLPPLTLSFTRCWRRVQQGVLHGDEMAGSGNPTPSPPALLIRLAQCRLQRRDPLRLEPRAVRAYWRPYPPLKGSRQEARQRALQKLQTPPAKC